MAQFGGDEDLHDPWKVKSPPDKWAAIDQAGEEYRHGKASTEDTTIQGKIERSLRFIDRTGVLFVDFGNQPWPERDGVDAILPEGIIFKAADNIAQAGGQNQAFGL